MPPVALAAGIGAAGSIGSSLIGSNTGGGNYEQAYNLFKDLPTGFTPEMYQYIAETAPQFFELPAEVQAQIINEDPTLRGMQDQSMSQMKDIAEKGYTASQQRAFTEAQRKADTTARGQNEALAQQFKAQGRGGAGIQAALQQMAQQAAQDRASQELMAQAEAEAKARQEANTSMFNMAGNVRSQDFTKNSANADIINQFNLENSRRQQEVRNANTQLANQYNQQNTAERRRVADANVGLQNQAKATDLENQYKRAAGMSGQLGNMAQSDAASGSAWGQTFKDIASGVGQSVMPKSASEQYYDTINQYNQDRIKKGEAPMSLGYTPVSK